MAAPPPHLPPVIGPKLGAYNKTAKAETIELIWELSDSENQDGVTLLVKIDGSTEPVVLKVVS
jgi:hypothetical protein